MLGQSSPSPLSCGDFFISIPQFFLQKPSSKIFLNFRRYKTAEIPFIIITMGRIDKIIINCSDSDWGDAEVIDEWHRERGWDGIGYHYIICNGRPKNRTFTTFWRDS